MGPAPDLLVERDIELALLADALDRAVAGDGAAVVIEADAGVGKTALLQAVISSARERGFTVLSARASELEQELALGAALRLFDHADPNLGTYAVAHRVYGELTRMAEWAPVLLCLDDVHWADPPSLQVLHHLVSRVEGLPVLILVTRRPVTATSDPVLLALAAPPTRVVRLDPLTREGTARLVTAREAGPVPPGLLDACHDASGGNPFLLEELIRSLASEGVALAGRTREEVATAVPDTILHSVLFRIGRCSNAAAAVARAVAVLGDAAPLHHVTHLTELDGAAVLAAGAELVTAGVLGTDRAFSFAHPLVAAAVRSDLDPHLRTLAHSRAAEVLRLGGQNVETIAAHLLHTTPGGDPVVVRELRAAAAVALARGTARSAVPLLRRALEEPPAAGDRGDVVAELGAAELEAGEIGPATEHVRAALDLAVRPADVAARTAVLARAVAAVEGIPVAVEVLDRGMLRLATEDVEHRLAIEVEAFQYSLFDARLYARGWDRVAAVPVPTGDTPAGRAVLAMKAAQRVYFGGTAAEAAALVRAGFASGQLYRDPNSWVAWGIAVFAAVEAGELDLAGAEIDRAQRLAVQRESPEDLAIVAMGRALLDDRRGRVDHLGETVAVGTMAIEAAPTWPLGPTLGQAFAALGAMAHAEEGDADAAAAALVRGGLDVPADDANAVRMLFRRIRANLALRRPLAVAEDVEALRIWHAEVGITWDPSTPVRAWQVQVATAQGDHGPALEQAEAELVHARHWGTAHALGIALRARGAAEAGAGAVPWLEEAVAEFARADCLVELARTRVELGSALRRAGLRADSRLHLAAGLDAAVAAGAGALATRAREELGLAGAKPRRDRTTGQDALTPAERRVVAMAAEGQTNREIAQALFVAVKTVEGHLRQAYGKLGVSGRAELAAVLAGDR